MRCQQQRAGFFDMLGNQPVELKVRAPARLEQVLDERSMRQVEGDNTHSL